MFASKLLSQGSIELDYQKSIKKCERKSVFGLFENLNISFSTGSAKKPTLYNWLLTMTINLSQKLAPEQSLYYKRSFSRFEPYSDNMPKMWLSCKFCPFFFAY